MLDITIPMVGIRRTNVLVSTTIRNKVDNDLTPLFVTVFKVCFEEPIVVGIVVDEAIAGNLSFAAFVFEGTALGIVTLVATPVVMAFAPMVQRTGN